MSAHVISWHCIDGQPGIAAKSLFTGAGLPRRGNRKKITDVAWLAGVAHVDNIASIILTMKSFDDIDYRFRKTKWARLTAVIDILIFIGDEVYAWYARRPSA